MNANDGDLQVFFQTLQDLLRGSFRDLLFGGHRTQSPLIIRLEGLRGNCIELRLPGEGCLHLETVLVFADVAGQPVNVAPHARVSSSSTYEGGEALLSERTLVDPENTAVGIHTDVGHDQWVRLEFNAEQSISEIHVYNRDDVWASRAWGLVASVSLDGISWHEVYNHGVRQAQLLQCLYAAAGVPGSSGRDRWVMRECIEVVQLLFAGRQVDCVERIERLQWQDAEGAAEIRQQVTKAILDLQQQVWNAHGIAKPFKYWSFDEKAAYLAQVKELVDDLQRLSENVCLGFGFVLAHVRDGDFIPHDDDVDVLIAFDRTKVLSIGAGLQQLESHLAASGYLVSGSGFSHRWVMKANWDWSHPYVDVFVGLIESGRVSWFPSERNLLEMQDVFPSLRVNQFGVECPIPRNPLRYLELTYGSGWRNPDPEFGHPWDQSAYADIA